MNDTPSETIVVGYDGREASEHALERAIADAKAANNGRVVAVVVDVFVESPTTVASAGWGYVPPIPEEGPVELQPLLEAARARLAEAGVAGEAVWGLGDPAFEIVRVARAENAIRIVVGHHHHSALGRFLGADVAARIQEAAPCEVVVMS